MITIERNGKFSIPDEEVFIGYTGDNLNVTKEFFVENVMDISLVYRMYLLFDDGTSNFFLLDSQVIEGGTKLTWSITADQIYKGGIVKLQIKASNDSGEVFHSAISSVLVQTSIEFSEAYTDKANSEFLQHEEYLNGLIDTEKELYRSISDLNGQLSSSLDDAPTANSTSAVKSGGVYSALQGKANYVGRGYVSDLSELDELTDKAALYHLLISDGLIEGLSPTQAVKMFYVDNYQVLISGEGEIFSRRYNNTSGQWESFRLVTDLSDYERNGNKVSVINGYGQNDTVSYPNVKAVWDFVTGNIEDFALSENTYTKTQADGLLSLKADLPESSCLALDKNYNVIKKFNPGDDSPLAINGLAYAYIAPQYAGQITEGLFMGHNSGLRAVYVNNSAVPDVSINKDYLAAGVKVLYGDYFNFLHPFTNNELRLSALSDLDSLIYSNREYSIIFKEPDSGSSLTNGDLTIRYNDLYILRYYGEEEYKKDIYDICYADVGLNSPCARQILLDTKTGVLYTRIPSTADGIWGNWKLFTMETSDGSVTTDKLAGGSVTQAKLSDELSGIIEGKADYSDKYTLESTRAWYSEQSGISDAVITGSYFTVGNLCILRASAKLIGGWTVVYYTLPKAAAKDGSWMCNVLSPSQKYTVSTNHEINNYSLIMISAADNTSLADETINFTLIYEFTQ